ncbi:adenosine kinase [Elysia marginata]|uniref:Adenosine kinase n=1 Tax=Elysia marginata TaxID=1093978 RepID=A0AAV4HSX8_9GAST|nr:adenosine kinase [Elysia marginata]
MDAAGVGSWFQVKPGLPTGSCLVLCTGSNRCLVTYGGASALLSTDSLDQEETKAAIKASQFFYCSGYSLIGCFDAVQRLALHASTNRGKVFALNMAATFVCQKYSDCFKSLLPFVDVLFGNTMVHVLELIKTSCN